jgi:hypothetical protein
MSEIQASLYAGSGRQCPFCPCRFSSEADFNSHARVCAERRDEKMGWRKGDSGDEICSSSVDAELADSIRRNGGSVRLGRFEVHLSKNGRWLVRKEMMFR